MAYLEKDKTLILRDAEGKLLPVEVELEYLPEKPTIKATPLTKGELQELYRFPEKEDEVIARHVIEPTYTVEEYKDLKIPVAGAIRTAILALSTDSEQEALHNASVRAVVDSEEAKKKDITPNKS